MFSCKSEYSSRLCLKTGIWVSEEESRDGKIQGNVSQTRGGINIQIKLSKSYKCIWKLC